MSADIKLIQAKLSEIIQSGGFLDAFLSKLTGPLMKVGVPLAKIFLAPFASMAAASAIDDAIQ